MGDVHSFRFPTSKRPRAKAHGAYGDSAATDLARAVAFLRARPHRLDQCMHAMGISTVSKAALWAHIRSLVQ
jgi:hypothetical protein